MTPEGFAQLKAEEGCRLTAYLDTVGVWTIGYGHVPGHPGEVWTQEEADETLLADVAKHEAMLVAALPWIDRLDPVRRDALIDMAFNLGVAGLLGFHNTLTAIQAGNYDYASRAMLASKWASQVGQRAVRLSDQMKTGTRA